MPPIKVSVLVPVYNGEKFLPECLDSILAQDCASMEILLVDDGSSDGSAALLEDYAARDPRIQWWKNPNNLGLARNFNCCLLAAKGEYIKYVLQDDKLISPLTIRKMVEVLDNHPEVSLVGSASQVLDGCSRVIELRKYFKPGVMDGRQTIMQCLERENLIGEPSVVMFRRAQATLGFDEQLPQILDLDMWFHLLEQGSFAYLAEPLCAFRQHAAQQTKVNRRNGINDGLLLITNWYAKLWVQTSMTRRALFTQIYNLRKNYGAEAENLTGQMMLSLGRGWHVMFWLRRKLTRPFDKLGLWIKRKTTRLMSAKLNSLRDKIDYHLAKTLDCSEFVFNSILGVFVSRKPDYDVKTAVCLFCKNENEYLTEWLEYHRSIGFNHFFIYDNKSTPPLSQTLAKEKDCSIMIWNDNEAGKQLRAYYHCCQKHNLYAWILFIDMDEFLILKKHKTVQEFLYGYKNHKALGLNWICFTSSGYENKTEWFNYNKYLPLKLPVNRHIKSFLKPQFVTSIPRDPHKFPVLTVNEHKKLIESPTCNHSSDIAYIRHNITRSKNEYIEKIKRGRGDGMPTNHSLEVFDFYDRESI